MRIIKGQRVAVASDHAGFEAKGRMAGLLAERGFTVLDLGTDSEESVDYPVFGRLLAEKVASGAAAWGILVCGSGIGMSITANRIPGARAALSTSPEMAELARRHNDANILVLPGRFLDREEREAILDAFLGAEFEGGRHERRVDLIDGLGASLRIPDHPIVKDRITKMRDEKTQPPLFRAALRSLAPFLVYEAARDLETESRSVRTPLGLEAEGATLKRDIFLLPILRAGLSLLEGALEIFPEAVVGLAGLYRDEKTFKPVEYYWSGPKDLSGMNAFILDPMLATGGSAAFVAKRLKDMGASSIRLVSVIAAPRGVERLMEEAPGTIIVAAALDDGLDERAYILPGLGDAGDRAFGT